MQPQLPQGQAVVARQRQERQNGQEAGAGDLLGRGGGDRGTQIVRVELSQRTSDDENGQSGDQDAEAKRDAAAEGPSVGRVTSAAAGNGASGPASRAISASIMSGRTKCRSSP